MLEGHCSKKARRQFALTSRSQPRVALTRMGRFLERIADHGVNIGDNTTYIVTAEFPGDTHLAIRDES